MLREVRFARIYVLGLFLFEALLACGGNRAGRAPSNDDHASTGGGAGSGSSGAGGRVENVPDDTGSNPPLGGQMDALSSPVVVPVAQPVRDAGVDAGPAIVPNCSGKPICETFETLARGKAPSGPWRTNPGGAMVRVDDRHAASGKQSLFIGTTSGGPGNAHITPVVFPRWAADALYGRMMLYFEDIPGKDLNVPAHAPIFWGEGDGLTLSVGGSNQPGGEATYYNLFFGGGCDQAHNQPRRFPKNRWFCLEWMWNQKTNTWSTWVDGAALAALNFTATPVTAQGRCWEVPAIERVFFGWRQNHATHEKLSMWMDDLELSTARVGCGGGLGF